MQQLKDYLSILNNSGANALVGYLLVTMHAITQLLPSKFAMYTLAIGPRMVI